MTTYNLDPNKAKEGSGRVSNRITETGAYTGVITVAKDITAGTGAKGIELTFKSDDGREARFLTLYTKNKEGGSIFGESQLHALMTCMKVKTITMVERVINEFDFELQREVPTNMNVYPELMNKPIGLVLQLEEYKNRNSETKEKMSYFTAFEASTKKLAAEILENKPAEALDKILQNIKDKRLKHNNETPAPASGGTDFSDDIPFAPIDGRFV